MPQIPKPGETLLGGVFKTFPGGKGANQAVASARLGAYVAMIGYVGDDIINITVAGDCFVGALAVSLCEGKSLPASAEFTSAAAALSVIREGAQPSPPYREEVIQFLHKGRNLQ